MTTRHEPVGRLRSLLRALAVTALLLVGDGPHADSASISVVTRGHHDPVAYIGRVFTVSGAATTAKRLYVKHRAAGGAGARRARSPTGNVARRVVLRRGRNGPSQLPAALAWGSPAPGCSASGSPPTSTPSRPDGRRPSTLPRARRHDRRRRLPPSRGRASERGHSARGPTKSSRRVYAKLARPTARRARATTMRAPEASRRGVERRRRVQHDANASEVARARYMICLWLAGDSGDSSPVGGVRQQTLAVVSTAHTAGVLGRDAQVPDRQAPPAVERARRQAVVHAVPLLDAAAAAHTGVRCSFVTPAAHQYKTVSVTWPSGTSTTMTSKALPGARLPARRGTVRGVAVDGAGIRTEAFRVGALEPGGVAGDEPVGAAPGGLPARARAA